MTLNPLGLALSLLLICLSTTRVTGQTVTVSQVKTTSLVLNWEREGKWADVGTYQVKIQANGYNFCDTTKDCFVLGSCSFHTDTMCALLPPCSEVVVWVTGGDYTAPTVEVQTAPAGVTNLTVKGFQIQREITWTNPSSSCFADATARVIYGGYYDQTMILSPTETSLPMSLCNKGSGLVTIRTRGGDGVSDLSSAVFSRVLGSDTVAITFCPNDGCTDMTVEWEYKPVCSEVTQFEVTATLGSTVLSNTTDITVTNTTFDDLELDTLYETCVSALDTNNTLIAASCTTCGTYPEVADLLTVVNVTDTTAEIEWEAPLCQTDDNIEYNVSSSTTVKKTFATTTNTNFVFTELSPATNYSFCVLVQHPDVVPNHTSVCTNSFTLPSAPEYIDVRIYKDTSLFISWPGELFMPELFYFVSWGDDLEYSNHTEYKSYTIMDYNETVGPNKICVQAEMKSPADLRSGMTCQEQPFAEFGDPKPDNTAMIVSVSVSAGVAVLLSVVLVVVAKSQEKHIKNTS